MEKILLDADIDFSKVKKGSLCLLTYTDGKGSIIPMEDVISQFVNLIKALEKEVEEYRTDNANMKSQIEKFKKALISYGLEKAEEEVSE